MTYRTAGLRVVTFNTHMSNSVRNGSLRSLVRRAAPHAIVLQEVANRRAIRRVRRVLGHGWIVRGKGDSIVCLHRDRFELCWAASPENGHGELDANGKARVRRATRVVARDKITGRFVSLGSVHCQPLGRGLLHSNKHARQTQLDQLNAFAAASAKRPEGFVVIDGGDFNQIMRTHVNGLPAEVRPYSAQTIWAKAGMQLAHFNAPTTGLIDLDAFFVRPDSYVKIVAVDVIPCRRVGDDHDAVMLTLRVQP